MFEKEIEVGKAAVIEAMRITRTIQRAISSKDSITKSDRSPVTIADFTSQAVICRILKDHFPQISIVAEERADALRKPDNQDIVQKILQYIDGDAGISKILNQGNLFDSIDLGGDEPTAQVFWALDPIDGTKGFLRGEQYAIALALIENGSVRLGILGCPNLEIGKHPDSGCLIYALRGGGAELLHLGTKKIEKIGVSGTVEPEKMRFVQSYESAHGDKELQLEIAGVLEMEGKPVEMDSQVKYGVVSTGKAEIYLRIPHPSNPDYKEKIWDHAAGSIIVEEAGGTVSDIFGEKLDFSAGKTLKNNTGILVSVPCVHKMVLEIINALLPYR